MKTPTLLSIFLILAFAQGCATREERFNILSVEPKHIPSSYFTNESRIWPDVGDNWKQERDFLGFEVITEEQTNMHIIPSEFGVVRVALIVKDCSGEIRQIFRPGVRFVGRTLAGKFEYESVIKYRRRIGKAEPTYYDLFEKPTELCFHIQTIEYLLSRGDVYRLQLNEEIKRIAEGQ